MDKCVCCGAEAPPGLVPMCRECEDAGDRELETQEGCPTCGCWHGYLGGYDCGG